MWPIFGSLWRSFSQALFSPFLYAVRFRIVLLLSSFLYAVRSHAGILLYSMICAVRSHVRLLLSPFSMRSVLMYFWCLYSLCIPFSCTSIVLDSLRGPFSLKNTVVQILYEVPFHVRVLTSILYAARSYVTVLLSKLSMWSVLIFEYWPWLLTRSFLMYEHCGHRFSRPSLFIYEHYCPISLCDPLSCRITVVFVPLCGAFPYTSVVSVFYAVRSQVRICYSCVFLLPHIAAESVQTHEYWQWSFLPPQAPFCTWILSMYPPQIRTAWTRAT